MAKRLGCTPRQARLIDWLKHPTGLPDHPAIDPTQAMWTAQEIVDETGELYSSRRACLHDLNQLRTAGVVIGIGARWRHRRTSELW